MFDILCLIFKICNLTKIFSQNYNIGQYFNLGVIRQTKIVQIKC